MAKNKKQQKKKSNSGVVSMDMDTCNDSSARALDGPEAMDTSERIVPNVTLAVANRNIKKSATKRRGYRVRKAKAIEKAVAKNEKTQEKVTKNQRKMQRVHALKSLY